MRRADGARRSLLPEEERAQTLVLSMKIRPARVSDVDGIARVHVESWRSTYRDIISADYLASLSIDYHAERWLEILRKKNSKNCAFVAEDKSEQIIGFASGGPQRDATIEYEAELYAIYLLESAQRLRLGSDLAQAVAGHFVTDGFKNMLVWVLENNPSRQFYEFIGGQYITKKAITIGDQELIEVAYGWRNLQTLLETNGY